MSEWRAYRKKPLLVLARVLEAPERIETLGGVIQGKKGDYLVKGVMGELYPVTAEIFRATYEAWP